MSGAAGVDRRRGRVIRPSQRRVIKPLRDADAPAVAPTSAGVGRGIQFPVLLGLLLLFGQSFQYVIDLPLAYLLTKIWPLLLLPLAVWGAARLQLAYRPILLLALACALGVAPLMGVMVLGDGLTGALASTAKVWPLLNGFSMAALLFLTKPAPSVLLRGILWLGAITLAAFVILALVTPQSAYHQDISSTKIFLWDQDRGDRLYLPMFFGFLSLFALARSLRERPAVWKFVLTGVAYLVLLLLYKQRTPILVSVLVILIGWAMAPGPWRRTRLALIVGAGGLAVVPAAVYLKLSGAARLLGGSLTARQSEADAAVRFLNGAAWRWITGVGSATRVGNVNFGDVVGSHYFFLADLGWLGVAFEYGLFGAAVLLLLGLTGLRQAARSSPAAPLLGAIAFDYLLFFLVSSVTTPIVFAPGEMTFCMALTAYLARLPADADPAVGGRPAEAGPAGEEKSQFMRAGRSAGGSFSRRAPRSESAA